MMPAYRRDGCWRRPARIRPTIVSAGDLRPCHAKDVEVTVRFKAVAGRIDRAGGIAVRLPMPTTTTWFAPMRWRTTSTSIMSCSGSRREIHGVGAKVTSDQWHTLSIKADGDRFTIGFNDKTLFTASDRTFAGAGKVALWTKADSVTRFDA